MLAIREAERIATKKWRREGQGEDGGASPAAWTRAFSIAMDTLSEPLLNGHEVGGRDLRKNALQKRFGAYNRAWTKQNSEKRCKTSHV
jgi:hypothetical protein